MLALHKSRYEYRHNKNLILENLKNFENADNDLEPVSLKHKNWAFIKEDLTEAVDKYME
jgi:hypothetical protein